MTTGKTIVLTRWNFVSKVMSLLLNMLSRLVITFLPRSKSLHFMAAVTICSDFGAQENKVCHHFHCFPIYLPWSNGTGCHDLSFLMLSFKPTFSLSSFTFIKRLLSSSLLSAIRVVSSAYLRLLIFLPAILIPACASSSPSFLLMYSAYKWNKHGDNIQPWRTPFPIWNQSVVPYPVLTWPCFLTCNLPLNCWKNLERGPGREPSAEMTTESVASCGELGAWQGLAVQRLLCVPLSPVAWQTLTPPGPPVNCLPSLWSPDSQSLPLNSEWCVSLDCL